MQLYQFPVFCVPVSSAMVRKGWSTLEVPDGWLQIVWAVRPPSEESGLARDLSSNVISLRDQHHKPCHHSQSPVRVFH